MRHETPWDRLSRRAFVRTGVGALLIGRDDLAALAASLTWSAQPSSLASRTQYLSEATAWDSAIRDLASAARSPVNTDSALSQFTRQVEAAASRLDRRHSWMVAQCLSDASLERWVRANLRDEASFMALVTDLRRSPKVLDGVPELTALRRRLVALKAEKIAIVQQVIVKQREIVGAEASSGGAAGQAAEAAECEATWAIVTAILVIVGALVVASGSSVTSAASTLSTTYRGTGADFAYSAAQSAKRSYQQCVSDAASLPASRRSRAIAACQLRWLEEMT